MTRSESIKKAAAKQVNIPAKSALKVKNSDIAKF
jgi:hypothetical protein